jgi:hypothetical protein
MSLACCCTNNPAKKTEFMHFTLLLSAAFCCCSSWGGIFWKGGVGYVTRDMLAAHMPAASAGSDALIMVCGPPGEAPMAGCCCACTSACTSNDQSS